MGLRQVQTAAGSTSGRVMTASRDAYPASDASSLPVLVSLTPWGSSCTEKVLAAIRLVPTHTESELLLARTSRVEGGTDNVTLHPGASCDFVFTRGLSPWF